MLQLILTLYLSGTPVGDLATDGEGRIYIALADADRAAAARVWVLDGSTASPVFDDNLQAERIALAVNPKGELYGASSRDYRQWGEFEVQIWKRTGPAVKENAQKKWRRRGPFETLAAGSDGTLYWSLYHCIMMQKPGDHPRILAGQRMPGDNDGERFNAQFRGIDAFAWGPDERLYFMDKGRIRFVTSSGRVETRVDARCLKARETLPKDLAVDDRGRFLLVYPEQKTVIRIDRHGFRQVMVQFPDPWQPLALTLNEDQLLILESGKNQIRLRAMVPDYPPEVIWASNLPLRPGS
ncbi:MAG: hypothetical protein QNK37_16225 [Acidobacteriota bacterium]|nr:hypothetical protein [Acidobacteriota bacterium]